MCDVLPLPAIIVVPWPWQAPLNWLGFGVCVLLCLGSALFGWVAYRKRLRPVGLAGFGRLWLGMWGSFLLCVLLGAFLAIVLLLPAVWRELSWYQMQSARLSSLGCLHTALFAADDRFRETLQPWEWRADASAAVMFVLFLVWMGFTGILGAVARGRRRMRGMIA